MIGSYDYRLVSLSILIAIGAAYAALDLAARITAARGRARLAWLAGGATAMGIGIWSMHYIGMLAFSLPVPVLYDWPTVLWSLIAAIFAAAVALFVVSGENMGWSRALAGSAIMGGGIAAMHYIGMAAMRLPASRSYDPLLLTLSIVFAIGISLVAIWLAFRFRDDANSFASWKITCAVVMGAAIPVMHYTGMAAARFVPSAMMPDITHAVSTSTLGFVGVSAVTLLVLGVAVLTAAVDRRFAAQKLQLDASERNYQSLVEGVKDYAIIMLTPDGHVATWNAGAERIEGYSAEEIVGKHFSCFYPEEDIVSGKPQEQLKRAVQNGRTEDQGWRVRRDRSRFWADVAVTPLWDQAGQLRGFTKIVRDTTERRQAEENLRDLSGRLLHAQDEERRRIARELHDSAGQLIAALSINLGRLTREANKIGADAVEIVRQSAALVDELSTEVRTISYLLHPPLLDEVGLVPALRGFVEGFQERSRIKVDFEIAEDFGRLSQDAETTIFRMVQESLTNIHRHSESPMASIRISRGEEQVRLEIQDRGKGIPAGKQSPGDAGVGIRGMRERVRQLGGKFEIRSSQEGTVVLAELPTAKREIVAQSVGECGTPESSAEPVDPTAVRAVHKA
jgi:PAS domain S-box-containing protein